MKREDLINIILDYQELIYIKYDILNDNTINDIVLINSDINSYIDNDFESFENNKELIDYIKYLHNVVNDVRSDVI